VPHDSGARVVDQYSLDFLSREISAVGDHHLASVNAAADADPTPVVDRDPGGSGRRVEQGVQQRPIGDRVRAIRHALGLSVRGGDRSRVEVIATDDDRCTELAGSDHLVEPEAREVALLVPEPTDASRQSLKMHSLPGFGDPAV
jgi:hypothetical protein